MTMSDKMNKLKNKVRQKCEVFARVVGYIRPIKNWNKGKAEEFKDRKEFDNGACK